MNARDIEALGFFYTKQLPSGEWAAVGPMLFTAALFVGVDQDGYESRYCYPDLFAAVTGLMLWDGIGDPPGPWIKHKGGRVPDRPNPETQAPRFRNIRIVVEPCR